MSTKLEHMEYGPMADVRLLRLERKVTFELDGRIQEGTFGDYLVIFADGRLGIMKKESLAECITWP